MPGKQLRMPSAGPRVLALGPFAIAARGPRCTRQAGARFAQRSTQMQFVRVGFRSNNDAQTESDPFKEGSLPVSVKLAPLVSGQTVERDLRVDQVAADVPLLDGDRHEVSVGRILPAGKGVHAMPVKPA